MKTFRTCALILLSPLLIAATIQPAGAPVDEGVPVEALETARSAAGELMGELLGELSAAMAEGGPPRAVRVCSEIAQEVQASQGRPGVEVGRTSLRVRNPANAPDNFERRWLESLAALHAAGELLDEVARVVETEGGGRELRYLKPIVIGAELCLRCHGAEAQLDPEVRRILAKRYPEDRATGYELGDLRGAMTVRVALPAE